MLGRLVLHCDANIISGLGHFSRCMSLVNAFRQYKPEVNILCAGDFNQFAIDRLNADGVEYLCLPERDSFSAVAVKEMQLSHSDLLIVDSYVAKQNFYDELTKNNIKWGVLDDYATLDFKDANLVINFRVNADRLFQYESKFVALGSSFMPLKLGLESIRKKNELMPVNDVIQLVVICIGGKDIHNRNGRLLCLVSEVFDTAEVVLLLSDQDVRDELTVEYENYPRIKIIKLQPDIEEYLVKADLLISGGGMLKYEGCYCGIPNATLSQTEEQYQDSLILEEEGVTLNLNLAYLMDEELIKHQLSNFNANLRQAMRARQFKVFPANANEQLVNMVANQLQ